MIITGFMLAAALVDGSAFTDLSIEQALAAAERNSRTVVLFFTSSSDGDCQHMEATAWQNRRVLDWCADVGMAVRVETGDDPDGATAWGVDTIPSLLWVQDGEVAKRYRGSPPPARLAAWLERQPGEPKTDSDLQCLFDDPLADPYERLSARLVLAERQAPEQALRDHLWLWHVGGRALPQWDTACWLVLGTEMRTLARDYPPAAMAFADLFEELQAAVFDGEASEQAWREWLSMSRYIGDQRLVAERIKDLLVQIGPDGFPGRARRLAERISEDQGCQVATAMLARDPPAAARALLTSTPEQRLRDIHSMFGDPIEGRGLMASMVEAMRKEARTPVTPTAQREQILKRLIPLVAAGRQDDGTKLASLLIDHLNDADTRAALVMAILKADVLWSETAEQNNSFGRHVASLPRPLKAWAATMTAWLDEAEQLPNGLGQAQAHELRLRVSEGG